MSKNNSFNALLEFDPTALIVVMHFGALVMLVPIFLLLELGRDVFYIDSDVVLLQDALQYIKNASKSYPELNMIVSQETRSCLFPSFYRINALATPLSQSHDVEPNTGIMYIRGNNASLALFRQWIEIMVEENVMNDQKLLQNLFLERGAIRSDCCNRRTTRQEAPQERSQSEEDFTYCLLDEFVFQNGMMEFFCSSGRRGSSVALYVLGMHAAIPSAAKLPMTVHPNYCGDKLLALNTSGLLLYDNTTDRCSRWNPDLTSFARRNWTIEVAQAKRSLQDLQEAAGDQKLQRSKTLRQFFGGIAQWPELTGADFVSSDDQLWLAVPRGPDIHPMSRSQLLHQKTKEGRTHGLSHPLVSIVFAIWNALSLAQCDSIQVLAIAMGVPGQLSPAAGRAGCGRNHCSQLDLVSEDDLFA
eukprot:gene13300-13412_t